MTVIVTITGKSMCSANSYFDTNGKSKCCIDSYCDNIDNNGKVYVLC